MRKALLLLALALLPLQAFAGQRINPFTGKMDFTGVDVQATDCSSYTTEGYSCWDTDDEVLYMGDGVAVNVIGPFPTTVTTASAVITDHAIVRGDGGSRGVQGSGVTIDDSNNITTTGLITVDSDSNGIKLGDDQDMHLYSNYAGRLWFFPAANTDIELDFYGTTNTGTLKWMEDENYFQFDDSAYFTTTVGMGIAPDSTMGLYLAKTSTATSGSGYGVNSYFTTNPSGSSSILSASQVGTNTKTGAQNMTGGWGSSGLMGGLYRAINNGTGTVANSYGIISGVQNTAAGTTTNGYGVYIAAPYIPSGAITNAYGLYIENITGGATLNYGIYSVGGINYFGGNIGIGTTAPDKRVEINDSGGACLRLTYNDSNGSASNYSDFSVSSSGDLTIAASGGDISIGDENIDMGGGGSVEIANAAAPTVDAAGEIAIDTTGDQLIYYGGAKRVLSYVGSKSFTILACVDTDDIAVWRAPYALTITAVHVLNEGAGNVVGMLDECDANGDNCAGVDGATDITGTAGSNVNDDGSLSNPSIDSGDYIQWHTTSVADTNTSLTVSFEYTIDAT